MKKILTSGITLLILITSMLVVFASSTTYTSTLSMSVNSTATGTARDYYEPNHKMAMTISSRENMNGPDYNYVYATLQKKEFISYSSKGTQYNNCKDINSTYNFLYGDQGSGTFRYYFYNNAVATMGDSFTSDYVAMTSYS